MLKIMYCICIVIYFLYLRHLVLKDAFESLSFGMVILLIIAGFIPILNLILTIFFFCGYTIANTDDKVAETILKKILFIK